MRPDAPQSLAEEATTAAAAAARQYKGSSGGSAAPLFRDLYNATVGQANEPIRLEFRNCHLIIF